MHSKSNIFDNSRVLVAVSISHLKIMSKHITIINSVTFLFIAVNIISTPQPVKEDDHQMRSRVSFFLALLQVLTNEEQFILNVKYSMIRYFGGYMEY